MKPNKPLPTNDADREIPALIELLHQTERRLEELTGGEVDTVADRDGRMIMLRRAQDHMRQNDAAKQAAILDALPANIALLDSHGRVISVNGVWRRFAKENGLQLPEDGIGLNYLELCDAVQGLEASEAHQVAAGIRSVISGAAKFYSLEYSCHSPTACRWFLMTATPMADRFPCGAVIMHLEISDRKRHETGLLRLGAAMDATVDAIYLVDRATMAFVHINSAASRMREQTREELLALGPAGVLGTTRAALERTYDDLIANGGQSAPLELVRLRQDGSEVCLELRRHATRAGGSWMIVTLVRDITERHKAEQKFKDLIESAPDAMLIVNRDGTIALCNAEAVKLFGWPRQELLGQNVDALVPTRQRGQHPGRREAYLGQPRARQMGAGLALLALRKDGSEFPAEINLSPLETDEGNMAIATIRDITVQKQAQVRIERLNRIYAVLSGINSLIVRVLDRDELFHEACNIAVKEGKFFKAAIAALEPDSGRLVLVASRGFDKPDSKGTLCEWIDDIDDGHGLISQAVSGRKLALANDIGAVSDGALRPGSPEGVSRAIVVLPFLVNDAVIGVIVLHSAEPNFFDHEEIKLLLELAADISFALDHIEKSKKVAYLAYYDQLTGLANRMLFLDRVTQYAHSAAQAGHKLAVILIDLERFKNINDSLGRPAGDALLQQVARWLMLRNGDANLVARVDADHFAVVLPELKPDGNLMRLFEDTIAAFAAYPFRLNDNVYRVAARIGVAIYPDDGAGADTLFTNAEAALKKAKAKGDRYLFYNRTMTDLVAGRLSLENQLRQALDREEFVLHYQPKVDLASAKLTGAEALIRWNDPRTGLVPPGRFIPILEETGLIFEVGRWALKKAVADYLRWRAAGLPAVRIAVNVSPLQLRHRDFIADIGQVICIDAQAPHGLELEITESVIMEDVKGVIAGLSAIRSQGVRIAMDDFGTGFSSLSYLAKLPVDTLKIDRSFVIEMTVTPEGLSLVSTIIQLAHSLKLKVVAEGVETEEQSRLLRLLNCDEMQGFLFSKPVPADIFEARFLAPSAAALGTRMIRT